MSNHHNSKKRHNMARSASASAPYASDSRLRIISEPGAAVRVERYNLTEEEEEKLTINSSLADIIDIAAASAED